MRPQGPYLHTMCDRSHHVLQFSKFFRTNLLKRPGLPQAYLLYGKAGQSHDNFVQRLLIDKIMPYAASIKGELEGTVRRIPAEIEPANDLEDAKTDLRFSIFERVAPRYDPEHMLASDLYNHPKMRPFSFIVLQHNFELAEWNGSLKELIEWYLTSYWAEVVAAPPPAQVLIFLNFIYPHAGQSLWGRLFNSKKLVAGDFNSFLRQIRQDVDQLYPCLLFDELGYPNQKDVCRTLSDIGIHDEEECPQWIEDLFRKRRGKVRMVEVERVLKSRAASRQQTISQL